MKKIIILSMLACIALSSVMVFSFNNDSGQDTLGQSLRCALEKFTNVSENGADMILLSSAENFKIFDISKDGKTEYLYEIYNNFGEMVKRETMTGTAPTIVYSSDSLLSIEIGVGTGTWLTQYYDPEKDIFSGIFESPIVVQNGMVAYMIILDNTYKLIFRNIFDKSKYCKEFSLNDFSPVANPVDGLLKVRFVDESTLEVIYLSGDAYVEKTAILYIK